MTRPLFPTVLSLSKDRPSFATLRLMYEGLGFGTLSPVGFGGEA